MPTSTDHVLTQVTTLSEFTDATAQLLMWVADAAPLLFDARFRQNLRPAVAEVVAHLDGLGQYQPWDELDDEQRRLAGLDEAQLTLKLQAFERRYLTVVEAGGLPETADALELSSILLKSLVGALPAVGSLAQELIDFIIDEMKRNWRHWWR